MDDANRALAALLAAQVDAQRRPKAPTAPDSAASAWMNLLLWQQNVLLLHNLQNLQSQAGTGATAARPNERSAPSSIEEGSPQPGTSQGNTDAVAQFWARLAAQFTPNGSNGHGPPERDISKWQKRRSNGGHNDVKVKHRRPNGAVLLTEIDRSTIETDTAHSDIFGDHLEYGHAEEGEHRRHSQLSQDDLDLDEGVTNKMPHFDRLENLTLGGPAFGHLLAVSEFLENFSTVLKIDKEDVPSLNDLVLGIQGSIAHFPKFMKLVKILLKLVLEYPGLPSGVEGRSPFGQPLRETGLTAGNYSYYLRIFLASRSKTGRELSKCLLRRDFGELSVEEKAATMAFMCDELLSCKNILVEIDRNMEESIRWKGEKSLREGKIRALKGYEARKGTCSTEQSGTSTPSSGATDSPSTSALHRTPVPGVVLCDLLTEEEKKATKEHIERFGRECEELQKRIDDASCKVRIVPLGEDRYRRLYWRIPRVQSILVEASESASASTSGFVCPDVIGCVEDLVESVVAGEAKDPRRPTNAYRRGWWTISSGSQLENLRGCLHERGIREKALSKAIEEEYEHLKALCREDYGRAAPPVFFEAMEEGISPLDQLVLSLAAVERTIDDLGERICEANFQTPEWRFAIPEDPILPVDNEETEEDDDDSSVSSWESHTALVKQTSITTFSEYEDVLERVKTKLILFEKHIERRYLDNHFDSSWLWTEEEMVKAIVSQFIKQNPERSDFKAKKHAKTTRNEQDGQQSDVRQWRETLTAAKVPSEIALAVPKLQRSILWEKSIMKVCCQICRKSENDHQLLLCDVCELGFHMYCFKPVIRLPEASWFCPLCVARTTDEPCCLVCQRVAHPSEKQPVATCKQCLYTFHAKCADSPELKDCAMHKEWLCNGCKPPIPIPEPPPKAEIKVEQVDASTEKRGKRPKKTKTTEKTEKATRIKDIDLPPDVLKKMMTALLGEIMQREESALFRHPVSKSKYPNYYEVVKHPMDLATIRRTIKEKKYTTADRFLKDLKLLYDNCRLYNEDDSEATQSITALRQFWTRRWRQMRSEFAKTRT